MTCYFPLSGTRGPDGKLQMSNKGHETLTVACGQCIGCRMARAQSWAVRAVHEASQHVDNCFLTLTYDDTHLPPDGAVNVQHFQKFIRRLRKKTGKRIRFFHCGEYGDMNMRPHYHALIFGHDFEDKILWSKNSGNPLFRSGTLEKLWPLGMSTIGTLNYKTAAYTARYVMKKVNGPQQFDRYPIRIDQETGEIKPQPEYVTMSRRPGLGTSWLERYWQDVYPHDHVIIDGKEIPPPKFYDRWMERYHPEVISQVYAEREKYADEHAYDTTEERLRAREVCAEARLNQLKREL